MYGHSEEILAQLRAWLPQARKEIEDDMNTETNTKSFSTDPDWYTTDASLDGVPTDVLEVIEHNAKKILSNCGGHKLAARMEEVIELIDTRLKKRGVR